MGLGEQAAVMLSAPAAGGCFVESSFFQHSDQNIPGCSLTARVVQGAASLPALQTQPWGVAARTPLCRFRCKTTSPQLAGGQKAHFFEFTADGRNGAEPLARAGALSSPCGQAGLNGTAPSPHGGNSVKTAAERAPQYIFPPLRPDQDQSRSLPGRTLNTWLHLHV